MPWRPHCWSPLRCPPCRTPNHRTQSATLPTELREHSDSVALRVRDALDHAAREWKIQQSHSLKEESGNCGSGRLDDADQARERRERLELPKARLALVIDQLEELFTAGFSLEVRQKYISALAGLVRSGRLCWRRYGVTFTRGIRSSRSDRARQAQRKIRSPAADATSLET